MTQAGLDGSRPATMGRYLERLSRRFPGPRSWSSSKERGGFWPDGAKLVISVSLQFVSGAQKERATSTPIPQTAPKYPDWLTAGEEYGFKEGLPRLLDVFQRRRVRVTSHMVGAAVDRNPELARQIVERGNEAAAHGQIWTPPPYSMTPEEERRFCETSIDSIVCATGVRPVGFHAFWPRGSQHTLEILRDLGFLYHVDDRSRDEPFLVSIGGKPFAVVPCKPDMNQIANYESHLFTSDQFAAELRNEFEMLYTEAETRRRMMSISVHDWIAGRPAPAKVLEEFIIYAQRRPGVVFMRKDEIARFALASAITPREAELIKDQKAA